MYYFLVAYNELGCSDTDVVYIDLLPVPDVDAGQDYTIVLGGFTQLHGDGAYTIHGRQQKHFLILMYIIPLQTPGYYHLLPDSLG